MKFGYAAIAGALITALIALGGLADNSWVNRAPAFDQFHCEYATEIIRLHTSDPARVGPGIRKALSDIWGDEAVQKCPFVPQSVGEAAADRMYSTPPSRFGLPWEKVLGIIRRGRSVPDPAPDPPLWTADCSATAAEAFAAGTTVDDLCSRQWAADRKRAEAARVAAQAHHGCSLENASVCRAKFPKAFVTCVNYGNSGLPQPWAKHRNGEKLRQGREAHCEKALAGPDLCGWDPEVCPGAPSKSPFSVGRF